MLYRQWHTKRPLHGVGSMAGCVLSVESGKRKTAALLGEEGWGGRSRDLHAQAIEGAGDAGDAGIDRWTAEAGGLLHQGGG